MTAGHLRRCQVTANRRLRRLSQNVHIRVPRRTTSHQAGWASLPITTLHARRRLQVPHDMPVYRRLANLGWMACQDRRPRRRRTDEERSRRIETACLEPLSLAARGDPTQATDRPHRTCWGRERLWPLCAMTGANGPPRELRYLGSTRISLVPCQFIRELIYAPCGHRLADPDLRMVAWARRAIFLSKRNDRLPQVR